MPLDPNKFTRKTGEALGAAQALARELNHSQVTPEHLLAALLGQPESVVLPVLERIGVSSRTLRDRVDDALARVPKVYGETAQQAQLSAGAYAALEAADAERADAGRRLPLHRAPAPRHERDRRWRRRPPPRRRGQPRGRARRAPGGARQPPRHQREPRGAVPGAREVRARPHRGRPQGQARPRHRARRGDPARHPGAVAPHQEQPGAHRRARRGQDRHRRGSGPAHRRGRRAREPAQQAAHRARHRRRWSRAPSTAASSRTA